MPYEQGSVTIETPSSGTDGAVGTVFRVAGSTTPCLFTPLRRPPDNGDPPIDTIYPPSDVTVTLDGTPQPTVALAAGWSKWEAPYLSVAKPGPHTVTVVARWSGHSECDPAEDIVTWKVVDSPLDLVDPQPGAHVNTLKFPVEISASHRLGITEVKARADELGYVTLDKPDVDKPDDLWHGQLQLKSDRVPAGGRAVKVDLQATSGDGMTHNRSVEIRAVDATAPEVLGFKPADGTKLPGRAVGAHVDVVISAQDAGQDRLTSVIKAIEVQVDDGAVKLAEPTPDPLIWITRDVFVPGANDHTLNVRAEDESGNLSTIVGHRVVVTTPADLHDLSRQTYLGDLLAFTTERLLTRGMDGDTLPPAVTAGQLGEAVDQDLVAAAHMGAAEAATPVRTLRLVVEALARYMRPGAAAPLAGWPLRDGHGKIAADTASGLADGKIEGASWVDGEDLPLLRFDPAASAHVRVGAEAAAQVRVRTQFTLVARIRPSHDTSEPGIVVNKEDEYGLARFPDGTLRWARPTTSRGWDWVDSGAVAAVGKWTHVVVAYDGERVRTWTDGVLRHSAPLTGPIGDVGPSANELWIGGRSTGSEYFAGDIADVAVFDRGLTEYEVHRLLGHSDDEDGTRLWVDDELPPGAVEELEDDTWEWVDDDPAPSSGAHCHRSLPSAGRHQHLFTGSESGFPVDRGDFLVTDVWLDPSAAPLQIMLQWRDADGSWEHRAYWGANNIGWEVDGTENRRFLVWLPAAGERGQLEAPDLRIMPGGNDKSNDRRDGAGSKGGVHG